MATFIGALQGVGKFVIINLCGGGVIRLKYFPTSEPGIRHGRRANWEEQNTTTGSKPLFYFNRDPRRLDVPELWLDESDTNQSVKPQMEAIYALQDESCEGTPPPLLVAWGDQQRRVILENCEFEEILHSRPGIPIRARAILTFKEIQEGGR